MCGIIEFTSASISRGGIPTSSRTARLIGFVVPVYYYGIPLIVGDFLQKQARPDKAELAIDEIARRVKGRSPGVFNDCTGPLPRLVTGAVYPLYKYGRKTGKFTVNKSCTGCGLCESICPRKAIKLENESPVWTVPQCEISCIL